MKKRLTNVSDQFTEFFARVVCWSWDTFESLLDILMDFFARMLELILAIMNLIFQVTCFLRDLCIEAMRTYLNVFRGVVNVIRNIKCDDVEDFASACIVAILWIEAVRIVMGMVNQNPGLKILNCFGQEREEQNNLMESMNDFNTNPKVHEQQLCSRKKSGKRNGRYAKCLQNDTSEEDLTD